MVDDQRKNRILTEVVVVSRRKHIQPTDQAEVGDFVGISPELF
jgi:hypothetical protein